MKKYILLYIGATQPTPEVMDGWTKWFGVLGNRVVDSGNPFGPGTEVSPSETKELAQDAQAIAGYTIINAQNLEEVKELAKDCPVVTSLRIYEALPM